MPVETNHLQGCLSSSSENYPLAFHEGRYFPRHEFTAAVSYWAGRFNAEPTRRYALFTETAYPFAVFLMALFQAGKEVWIPGNNRPGTAQQLQDYFACQLIGDWEANSQFDFHLDVKAGAINNLPELNTNDCRLVLFTSGSTGEPKPVSKNLSQLVAEINALEKLWSNQLGASEMLSTVSHQHIYGLLFRILWPLAAGRCFHSRTYLNADMLVNSIGSQSAYWVASPAHLKRLDAKSPWQAIGQLKAIFSSGGALPEAARQQLSRQSNQQVIEIYGSTETGGIAWKDQEAAWTLFPGMSLHNHNGQYHLRSPYLVDEQVYPLEDQITLLADGRFTLNGRADRIVKVEEKRLSLTELEQRLADNPWVQDAFALVLSQHRDVVCVAVELTETGWQMLNQQGRKHVFKQLNTSLQPWFEAVQMPRKWLFINKMPLTAQAKVDLKLLTSLLGIDKTKLPVVQSVETTSDGIKLGIKVPQTHELIYFPDHFAGYPILPGVVQLAWVEHFGKLLFGINHASNPFSHLEAIKYLKVIRPEYDLTLTLKWLDAPGELHFNFSDESEAYSSGRMVYISA